MPEHVESLGPTPECPSLDALAAATVDPQVKQHLDSCAHCQNELAMFQEFEGAEPRPEEKADLAWVNTELSRRRSTTKVSLADRFHAWFTLPRLSIAAVALLVLIVAGVYLPSRNGSRVPGAQEGPVWRSGQFAALAPIGDLDRAPTQFRWEAVTGAETYRVRLLEVDGTPVWSTDTRSTTVEIPNTVVAKMIAGRTLQWSVEARDSDGRQIAATNLQSFHITVTPR